MRRRRWAGRATGAGAEVGGGGGGRVQRRATGAEVGGPRGGTSQSTILAPSSHHSPSLARVSRLAIPCPRPGPLALCSFAHASRSSGLLITANKIQPLTVSFHNLSFAIKQKKKKKDPSTLQPKVLLHPMSGVVRPGELLAIMGAFDVQSASLPPAVRANVCCPARALLVVAQAPPARARRPCSICSRAA